MMPNLNETCKLKVGPKDRLLVLGAPQTPLHIMRGITVYTTVPTRLWVGSAIVWKEMRNKVTSVTNVRKLIKFHTI